MPRKYELKRRAERQVQTRRRIAEAALELHTLLGPARTTVSAIAERAGVQRHTFYRHFPDELSLGLACSRLHVERDPPPDPEPWAAIKDPSARLRAALTAIYGYFERNELLLANVMRDAQIDPPTAQVVELRFGPWAERVRQILREPLPAREGVRAVLDLALDFHAWRCLRQSGLSASEAAELMSGVVACVASQR